MATVPLSMDHAVIPFAPSEMGKKSPRRLHRIRELRKQQGVSLRTASRKLGMPASQVREEEKPDTDLLVSELLQWAEILDVPIADLLEEPQNNLSSPIRERAKLVRIMKTVKAISERTQEANIGILSEVLVDQLIDLMPELAEINAWNNVGQRRSLNDLGQIAERSISCDSIISAMRD
ncbi:helix-turn-helix domain-containing protein [Blastopirellula marina]|nr:helix-turn-helix domain-containing protein [Blastopirellula marina]PTL45007.1 hypothetical protein C5Y97_09810 [Blastopirellula marina]